MFGVPWNGDTIAPPDVRIYPTHMCVNIDYFYQMNRYFSLASADLVVPNQDAWGLLQDFTTLRELGNTLPGNTPYVPDCSAFLDDRPRGYYL